MMTLSRLVALFRPLTGSINAAQICTSQMKHLLGLTMVKRGSFVETWQTILSNLGEVNLWTLTIGLCSLVLMLGLAKVNAKIKDKTKIPIPEQLVAVILATSLVYFAGLSEATTGNTWSKVDSTCLSPAGQAVDATDQAGCQDRNPVLILGDVPQGLPSIKVPDTRHWAELLHGAIVVTIIGFSLVIATGKTFAEKHGYEIDANQELLAIGAANVLGGCLQAYPASSSLSRSALANAVGSKTPAYVSATAICSSLPHGLNRPLLTELLGCKIVILARFDRLQTTVLKKFVRLGSSCWYYCC